MLCCCKECNEFHRERPPKQAGLKHMSVGALMKVLHVDLTGPHVNCQGYRYVMTACDALTTFVITVPLWNKTAFSVVRALVHEVVLKYGMLQSILTGLGGELHNELWKELCQLLGITRVRTTAYCPSTNGKIERWHRSLHAMMAKIVDTKQKKWAEFLPFVIAAYNSTTHGSTSFSPIRQARSGEPSYLRVAIARALQNQAEKLLCGSRRRDSRLETCQQSVRASRVGRRIVHVTHRLHPRNRRYPPFLFLISERVYIVLCSEGNTF